MKLKKSKTWEQQVGLFDEPEIDMSQWLCKDCGKPFFYLGQIAGMVIKSCEICGTHSQVLLKFDVSKKAQGERVW